MYKNGKYIGNIYIITCLINNKIYIGQTRNEIYDRWAGHKHDALKNNNSMAICKAIRKYGIDNFKIELLEKIITDSQDDLNNQLNAKEIYYIKQYHSLTHENGYNITIGGNNTGAAQKSKTYCYDPKGELIGVFDSRADAGKYIGVKGEDISAVILRKGLCRGYYFSSSPIFDYNIQHPMKERKIKSYDYDGNMIAEYDNAFQAATIINGIPENIYNTCMGLHASAHGYIWRFSEDYFNKYDLPNKRTRCINQYSIENKYIKTYDSIKDAARAVGVNPSNISAVLSAKYKSSKTSGGYKWFYSNDLNQPDLTKIIKE